MKERFIPKREADPDNEFVRMQPLKIKKGYYKKYPGAMSILESSAYGKNELILQALQYVYDIFPVDIYNRDTVKAFSTVLGFDKNGDRIDKVKKGRRKSNLKGKGNLVNHSSSDSHTKAKPNQTKVAPETTQAEKPVTEVKANSPAPTPVAEPKVDIPEPVKVEKPTPIIKEEVSPLVSAPITETTTTTQKPNIARLPVYMQEFFDDDDDDDDEDLQPPANNDEYGEF